MTLPYVSPAETSSLSSARILVVDDEPLIRQSIGQTLQKQGHQVALAADGRDALEQLGTATFELVICDIPYVAHGRHRAVPPRSQRPTDSRYAVSFS